ncbi:MAG: hypothetical protein M3460_06520 [Actinomycetota bacterium]|nr:hypothetical protein [Actinomycetota bacterium]
MPYGRPGAHWALLADGAVTLRRTTYDPEQASKTVCHQSSCVAAWTTTSCTPRQRRRRHYHRRPRDGC